MKTSSLLQHIGIAIALTCIVAINDFFFNGLLSTQFNISLIIFLYLICLIWLNPLVAGNLTLLIFNLGVLLFCLFSFLPIVTLLWFSLAIIWLNRILLCYSSILAVVTDLGLCLISAYMVYWLLFNAHSFIFSVWCLLFLQALHSLIPGKKNTKAQQTSTSDHFDHALEAAESALQQLIR